MILRKNSNVSLKIWYPITVRMSILLSILILIVLGMAFPRFEQRGFIQKEVRVEIEQFDIPHTQQFEPPPPPPRPAIPIESESEELAEDVTIHETDLDDYPVWEPPPPPPPEGPDIPFFSYDEPPVPTGGYDAIRRNIIYPEIARQAGVEGTVVIYVFIDETGRVKETVVLKGIPMTGLDEAAMEGIRKTHFKPARQRDKDVAVWITIPVTFRLRG